MRGNSQRFFDSVPSRLRPQGTPLRMTGWYDAPLRGIRFAREREFGDKICDANSLNEPSAHLAAAKSE